MRAYHRDPHRAALAPAPAWTGARAVDARGAVLRLQRSAGNAAVGRLLRDQRSAAPRRRLQREKTSGELLTTLAKPKIGKPQAQATQIKLVDALDQLFGRESEYNLGGILIDSLPTSDEDLLKDARLVRLPTGFDPDSKTMITGFKSVGEDRGQAVVDAGLGGLVVENTLKTMIDARQIEYLRMAGLPNEHWKILVEVHYISARPKDMSGFHKDTRNETLFVNLNYHVGDRDVVGPEYVVNPHPPEEHEAKIAGTLPPEFMKDLKETRATLPPPTEIKTGVVGPYGYVAFVDEAIHHTTPHYGHRVVTPGELDAFLTAKHAAEFAEMKRAADKFAASYVSARWWPLESYVNKSIIKESEIPRWQAWVDMARDANPTTLYTREDFKAKGMPEEMFERMLAFVGSAKGAERKGGRAGGFEKVLVNSTTETVEPRAERPRFTRQMSSSNFQRPPQLPENVTRRFIRTWVRAIPADKAREMQKLLDKDKKVTTATKAD